MSRYVSARLRRSALATAATLTVKLFVLYTLEGLARLCVSAGAYTPVAEEIGVI